MNRSLNNINHFTYSNFPKKINWLVPKKTTTHCGSIYAQLIKIVCFLLLTQCYYNNRCYAQLSRNSQEVWPSMDAYYRINSKFRIYGTVAGTKKEESNYSDAAVGLFVDYFTFPAFKNIWPDHPDSLPGKFLWLRGGYQYSATPPSSEDPFKESMLVTEGNNRFYLPLRMLLTLKSRFDWRFNNGEFKARYRPKITLERDIRTYYLFFTAYGWIEYYANFGESQVNRFKSQLGAELRVTRIINYEIFWNHQFANSPEVEINDAFGMTLKLYMEKNTFKKKPKKSNSKT